MNAYVDSGMTAFASGSINWGSDTIRAALMDATFTPTYDSATPPNINNADFFSDISSAVVGSPVALSGKTQTAGLLVAANPTFSAVTGNTVVRVAVYKWTGVAGTSQLILMYDAAGTISVVPNGGNILLFWDTGIISAVAGVGQI